MRYRFIGETPSVLGEFSHDRNATVTRAAADAPPDKSGSTVVVFPGDIIDTPDEIVSGLFEQLDAVEPPVKMRKPELVEALAALGLDTTGTADELRERLANATPAPTEPYSDGASVPTEPADDGNPADVTTPETEGDPS